MSEPEAPPQTYLHEAAAWLDALAWRLDNQAPPGRRSVYAAWAGHLRQDAKNLYLLGEAAAANPEL